MDRSTSVCKIVEQLHEELDEGAEDLTPFQVGTVLRAAAEFVVDAVDEERASLLAYIEHYHPNDSRLKLLIAACQDGVHRRSTSTSMEAVVERRG